MKFLNLLFGKTLKFVLGAGMVFILSGCDKPEEAPETLPGPLLYVWAYDADGVDENFLMVVDADQTSGRYGKVISTVPLEGQRGGSHHTHITLPFNGVLFANDFSGNATWILDTNTPETPVVTGSFQNIGEFSYPHSFAELQSGNTLATFQTKGEGNEIPGGLLELTPQGELVQAIDLSMDNEEIFIRPYGIVLLPDLDRVVVTDFDMRGAGLGRHVFVLRLSNLELLNVLPVPDPEGREVNINPFEGRVLADGKAVMFETLSCGLYLLEGVEGATPEITFLHDFEGDFCSLPVRLGEHWVQTIASDGDEGFNAMVVLEVSDPKNPVEVHRLDFPSGFGPHWTSPDETGTRIVVTGYGSHLSRRVLIVNFDPETGRLAIDENFGTGDEFGPGLMIDLASWPHGDTGPAIAHGAVFWPSADPDWKTGK